MSLTTVAYVAARIARALCEHGVGDVAMVTIGARHGVTVSILPEATPEDAMAVQTALIACFDDDTLVVRPGRLAGWCDDVIVRANVLAVVGSRHLTPVP